MFGIQPPNHQFIVETYRSDNIPYNYVGKYLSTQRRNRRAVYPHYGNKYQIQYNISQSARQVDYPQIFLFIFPQASKRFVQNLNMKK